MAQGREEKIYRVIYVAGSSQEVRKRHRDRLRRLRDAGFEVHILAGDDGGLRALIDEGFHVQALPITKPANLPGQLAAYFICQGYFLENPPVLVHAFGHRGVLCSVFAAQQARVPAIFVTLGRHWLSSRPARLLYRRLADQVDQYIVRDEETMRRLETEGVVSAPKLVATDDDEILLELYDFVLDHALRTRPDRQD